MALQSKPPIVTTQLIYAVLVANDLYVFERVSVRTHFIFITFININDGI